MIFMEHLLVANVRSKILVVNNEPENKTYNGIHGLGQMSMLGVRFWL